jgi:glycosyl transferase family 2
MNEMLRLFDRMLKKQGYAIKKHSEYNLWPLKNLDGFNDLKKVYEDFNSVKSTTGSNVDKLIVCLRTCLNEKRAAGSRNELTGVGFEEHLLRCISSLQRSMQYANDNGCNVELVIFDDRSEKQVVNKIKSLFSNSSFDWRLMTTEKPGQGPSLHEGFKFAKDKNSLVYFCEDDYLHTNSAIFEMISFYKDIYTQTGSHLLLYPQEHDIVFKRFNYPSYILYTDVRRWRTISHATHTFFTHSDTVDKYWEYFENTKYVGTGKKRHLGSEKKTTDKLFNHIIGFSPIPALAVHLQTQECLPPFFDWKSVWKENNLNDK